MIFIVLQVVRGSQPAGMIVILHCNSSTLIQELVPKLPFICCTKYHLATIYHSKDMSDHSASEQQYNAQYHAGARVVRNRRSRTRTTTHARTHAHTEMMHERSYSCCAVRWVVADKDIVLIANFGGLIIENRKPQLGSFYCPFLRI